MKSAIVKNNSILLNSLCAAFIILFLTTTFSCVKVAEIESERQDFSLDLPSITDITLDFPATVILKQGTTQNIRVHAQREVFDLMTKEVYGEKWEIALRSGSYSYEPVTIYITVPTISSLETTSTGDIVTKSVFSKRALISIATRSTGDISYKGDTEALRVWVDGTGSIDLAGATTSFAARIEGTGDVHAFDLLTKKAAIEATSTGSVFVSVEEALSVSIAGTGDIHYKGAPKISSLISGTGKLVNAN